TKREQDGIFILKILYGYLGSTFEWCCIQEATSQADLRQLELSKKTGQFIDFPKCSRCFPEYFHVLLVDLVEPRHHLRVHRMESITGGLFPQIRFHVGIGRVTTDNICRQTLPFFRE